MIVFSKSVRSPRDGIKGSCFVRIPYYCFGCLAFFSISAFCADTLSGTLSTSDSNSIIDRLVILGQKGNTEKPSVKTIKAEDIKGRFQDLPSVLQQQSGITIQRAGAIGEYSTASIRGEPAGNVKVFLDGMPLNSASDGVVDLSKIPLGLIQRMDIYKGCVPIELSEEGVGNVINLSSKNLKNIISGNFQYGSFGYTKGGALLSFPLSTSRHSISLDAVYSQNNYPFPDQTTHYAAMPVIEKINNRFLEVGAVYNGMVPITHSIVSRSEICFIKNTKGTFLSHVENDLQGMSTTGQKIIFIEKIETNPFSGFFLTLEGKGRLQSDSTYTPKDLHIDMPEYWIDKSLMGQVKLNTRFFAPLFSLGGFLLYNYENDFPESNGSMQIQAKRNRFASAISLEYTPVSALKFKGLYLYSYVIDAATGTIRNHVIPPIKTNHLNDFQLEAQLTLLPGIALFLEGYGNSRAPTFFEKFGRGRTFSGNPELVPETRYQAEAGVSLAFAAIKNDISFFAGRTDEKIISTMQSQGMFFPNNYASVLHYGAEWNLETAPVSFLSLSNNFSYIKNLFFNDDEPRLNGKSVALIPDLKESVNITAHYRDFQAFHSLLYCSPDFFDNDNTAINSSKPVLSAGIRYSFFSHYAISYRIENYLDQHNIDFQYNPKPGRAHYIEFNADFSIFNK
jgi:outer membrane receptor protein involved in Fe transport